MTTVSHVCTLDYVAKMPGEDPELLEAIVHNDDNLAYGAIISVHTGPDETVTALTDTALTDDGIGERKDMLREARITPRTRHDFPDDFVHDAALVARIKAQSPRQQPVGYGDGGAINLTGDDLFRTNGGFVETIFPGSGNDSAFGGGSFDVIHRGNGRDILHGDGGDDQLIGGNHGDAVFGNGADRFVFKSGDGIDRINDFNAAQAVIDLPSGTTFSLVGAGADTLLDYGTVGDQVLLVGVDLATANTITFI